MASDPGLQAAECHDRSVHVTWQDGARDDFHFLWLRDNCGRGDCRHLQGCYVARDELFSRIRVMRRETG